MIVLALASGAASIVGGTTTQVGDYPTTVAVVFNGTGTSLCTGVLVSPHLVLTAANCVDPSSLGAADQAAVTAGTTVILDSVDVNQQTGGTTITAAQTIPSAAFAGLTHNIGAVVLSTAVTDRDPSLIATSTASLIGDPFTLVGFGASAPQGTGAGVERTVTKNAVSCTPFGGSDTSLVCFDQSDGSGSCGGDSGAPAFDATGTLVGLGSYGDQNCAQFGAFTRVSDEADFIASAFAAAGDTPTGPDAGASPDAGGNPDDGGDTGCCSTSGGGGSWLLAAFAALALRRKR